MQILQYAIVSDLSRILYGKITDKTMLYISYSTVMCELCCIATSFGYRNSYMYARIIVYWESFKEENFHESPSLM